MGTVLAALGLGLWAFIAAIAIFGVGAVIVGIIYVLLYGLAYAFTGSNSDYL